MSAFGCLWNETPWILGTASATATQQWLNGRTGAMWWNTPPAPLLICITITYICVPWFTCTRRSVTGTGTGSQVGTPEIQEPVQNGRPLYTELHKFFRHKDTFVSNPITRRRHTHTHLTLYELHHTSSALAQHSTSHAHMHGHIHYLKWNEKWCSSIRLQNQK